MDEPSALVVEVRVRRARKGRPARACLACPACQQPLEVLLLRPIPKPKRPARCPDTAAIPGTETAEDVAKNEAWLAKRGAP